MPLATEHPFALRGLPTKHKFNRIVLTAGKLEGPYEEGTSGGPCVMSPDSEDIDLESVYSDFCSNVDDKTKVIFQNAKHQR